MGTHPIFESDFDCLTECPIKTDIEMSSSYQRHIDVLDDGRPFNVQVLKDQIYKVENELERDKKAVRKLLKSVNAVHSSIIEQSKNEKTLSEQLGNHAIAL